MQVGDLAMSLSRPDSGGGPIRAGVGLGAEYLRRLPVRWAGNLVRTQAFGLRRVGLSPHNAVRRRPPPDRL